MKTLCRIKTWQNDHAIGYDEYNFFGFIGHKKGFKNKWWCGLIPFANNKGAWHILGFRFTKSPMYVSRNYSEINGWHTTDTTLVNKLRNL